MQIILQDYPWMIIFIAICIILSIVAVACLIVIKKKSSQVDSVDAEQQKIIDEVIKEEQEKLHESQVEEKELENEVEEVETKNEEVENTEVIEVEDSETINPEDNEEIIENEEEDMYIQRKRTTITSKTRMSNVAPAPKGSQTTRSATTKQPTKRVVNGKYEVFEENGQYQYILKASNGEVLVESQKYASYDNVISAIDTVQNNLEYGKYDITSDKKGLYQFTLKAGNSRTLVMSASYTSKTNAENALASFKRFAASAPITVVDAPKKSTGEVIEIENVQPKANGKFTVEKQGTKFVFNLVANNGEILCTSTPYASKSSCVNGIDTFRTNIVDGTFVISKDKRKNYQFELYSQSNRLIVKGHTYEDKTRAISSANSVVAFIDGAEIKE